MTIREIRNLNRNETVIYKGEKWKYKSYGTVGTNNKIKIQRGNEIIHTVSPEDLSMSDEMKY